MQRLKLLGPVLVAVLAFRAMATAVSSAETEEKPNALPVGVKFTLKNKAGTKTEELNLASSVKCANLSGKGEMNKNLGMDGTVDLLFGGVKAKIGIVEAECTSLTAGVAKGDI